MSDQPILQIQDLCKDFKVRSSKLFEKSKQLQIGRASCRERV